MREFFKQELKTLKAKTGLNQYENLSALPDAEFQFKILFDSLELACEDFKYIPDKDKERIIQKGIVTAENFTGLNSRVVWAWLNANKEHFWAVETAKQSATSEELKTFDELKPDLQAEIRAWQATLLIKEGLKPVPQVSQQEIDAMQIQDERSRGESLLKSYEPKPVPVYREKLLEIYQRKTAEKPYASVKVFNIDGITISAESQEEAQEIFLELLGDKDTV